MSEEIERSASSAASSRHRVLVAASYPDVLCRVTQVAASQQLLAASATGAWRGGRFPARSVGGRSPVHRVSGSADTATGGPRYPALRFFAALATAFGAAAAAFVFEAAVARSALTGFFFSVLTASRLRRSASIRSTTFGGSCTSVATTSSPAILASMILRSPSRYSSL